MRLVDDSFVHWKVAPEQMDRLWAQGWRHFGAYFFRYSLGLHWGDIQAVIPLRIDLTKFIPSRSQKRALARNIDLKVVIRETEIDQVKESLFYRHRQRFKENIPDSIYDFLSHEPATTPCPSREICAYHWTSAANPPQRFMRCSSPRNRSGAWASLPCWQRFVIRGN
jgi:arginine-tRNA-protein transferase